MTDPNQNKALRTYKKGGKSKHARRLIPSAHWTAWDELANAGNMAGTTLVSRLIHEILTDTDRAVETCKRLKDQLKTMREEKV